ncbi:MAG: GNAT family N-acetyltransferase [Myxococcota bacterium]
MSKNKGTKLIVVNKPADFPEGCDRDMLAQFLHRVMKPWEDKIEDIKKGLEYSFNPDRGGFIILAYQDNDLVGATVFLFTGMEGYVPENILLFIGVEPEMRGKGIGTTLMEAALKRCKGDIKLHVESDNPASNLYKRMGFAKKYDEMRYVS